MVTENTQPSHAKPERLLEAMQQGHIQRQRNPRNRLVIVGCLIATLLFLIILIIALPVAAYAYYQINGLIVPGVIIGNLEMGGLTRSEAKKGLDRVYGQEMDIYVSDGRRTWKAKASDFGVGWDTEAMTDQAQSIAHGNDFITEISEMFKSLFYGQSIEPILSFDIDAARIELLKWEATVNIPSNDAEIRIKDGEVEITPAEIGLVLDVESTLSNLSENPQALIEKKQLDLVVVSQEPEITDLSSIKNQAETWLNAEVIIHGYDPIKDEAQEWEVDRVIIGSWLVLQKQEEGYQIYVDPDQVRTYAAGLNDSLSPNRYLEVEEIVASILNALDGGSGSILRIYYTPTTYLIQPGETLLEIGWELGYPYWILLEANPYLYSSPLQTGDEIVIPSMDTLLPLPVIPNKRIIISISEQRLRAYEDHELLYEFIVSTGIEKSPTQPGIFQVRTHELNAYASKWDLYMPHFLGIYEAGPDFMNGIHGLPMLSSGRRLWADVLGRPASYGCIILDLDDAETLYSWAEDGVVVEILE